jgi:hypothetical protein
MKRKILLLLGFIYILYFLIELIQLPRILQLYSNFNVIFPWQSYLVLIVNFLLGLLQIIISRNNKFPNLIIILTITMSLFIPFVYFVLLGHGVVSVPINPYL